MRPDDVSIPILPSRNLPNTLEFYRRLGFDGFVHSYGGYAILMRGTIEEKIRGMQRDKSALADDVLGEESFAKTLTVDDLKFLFADDAEQE